MRFKEKSDQSLNSARIMLSNSYYPSAVNRSYYSVLQYSFHILFERLKFDQNEFNSIALQNKEGSHVQASKLICIELIKKDRADYKWYQSKMPAFKKLRILADYQPDPLDQLTAQGSITTAESILNVLRKNF